MKRERRNLRNDKMEVKAEQERGTNRKTTQEQKSIKKRE